MAVKKKVATAPAKKPVKAIATPMTKTQIMSQISENTGLSRKQVGAVFDELSDIIEGHVKKRGAGQFTLPGLMKIKTVKKPAVKARKGINPFTGEPTTFKARPATTKVRILPLKKLKDMPL